MQENQKHLPEEKQDAAEISVSSPFLKRLENFWYHNKWWIPIAAAFSLFFIIALVQCSGKENTDMIAVFSGPYTATAEEIDGIQSVLQSLAPKKPDGSTRKIVLQTFAAYNEEQLRQMYTETDEDGKEHFDTYGYNTAKSLNADRMSSFSSFLMTGECAAFFVSEDMYLQQNMQKLAAPLEQTFQEVPEAAYDAYAIRLGDTEFYRYYKAVQVLPADTLIVLTQSYVWGASGEEEQYDAFVQMYRSIVQFRRP